MRRNGFGGIPWKKALQSKDMWTVLLFQLGTVFSVIGMTEHRWGIAIIFGIPTFMLYSEIMDRLLEFRDLTTPPDQKMS